MVAVPASAPATPNTTKQVLAVYSDLATSMVEVAIAIAAVIVLFPFKRLQVGQGCYCARLTGCRGRNVVAAARVVRRCRRRHSRSSSGTPSSSRRRRLRCSQH